MKIAIRSLVGSILATATLLLASPALAQQKYVFGVPGIPAVFGGTVAFVAEKEGFFKKHGVDVTVRQFETGAAASRAVGSGEITVSLSPSPLIINQISNANAPLIALWGMEHPDWLIATTEPNGTCATMKGQGVGVDSLGGARSIALRTMMAGGCKMKIEEVQQVALGSNVGTAMVAGQLKYGVLHIDDIPVIEAETKQPLRMVISQKDARPDDHYLLLVANRDQFAKNRDAYVRIVAGLIEAERFLRNPANADKVAQHAAPTGRNPAIARQALKSYIDMEFWPRDKDGLTPAKIEAVKVVQQKVGNLKGTPAPYERIADPSVWKDAMALVK